MSSFIEQIALKAMDYVVVPDMTERAQFLKRMAPLVLGYIESGGAHGNEIIDALAKATGASEEFLHELLDKEDARNDGAERSDL